MLSINANNRVKQKMCVAFCVSNARSTDHQLRVKGGGAFFVCRRFDGALFSAATSRNRCKLKRTAVHTAGEAF